VDVRCAAIMFNHVYFLSVHDVLEKITIYNENLSDTGRRTLITGGQFTCVGSPCRTG
jgi:hypothetical protein